MIHKELYRDSFYMDINEGHFFEDLHGCAPVPEFTAAPETFMPIVSLTAMCSSDRARSSRDGECDGSRRTFDYDLVVIGTGKAGPAMARQGRRGGWRVAITDELPYGGTCNQRGCVPEEGAVAGAQIALDDVLVARPDHDLEVQGAPDRPGLDPPS